MSIHDVFTVLCYIAEVWWMLCAIGLAILIHVSIEILVTVWSQHGSEGRNLLTLPRNIAMDSCRAKSTVPASRHSDFQMDKYSITGAVDQRNTAEVCTQPVHQVRACRATRSESCRFLGLDRFPANLQHRELFCKVIIGRSDGRVAYAECRSYNGDR